MSEVSATRTAGVQSVDRALEILEVLARVGEAGITEVAAELGVHKSTAFRLVATLEQHRLDQVAGSSALQPHNWVGQHIPLHATSNGKVLLSGLDRARLDEVLGGLSTYTDHTITTKKALRDELDRVREQGYAVAVDELEVGLTAVAAPIRNNHGDVVASMSVSGPTFRITPDHIDDVVAATVQAAEEVSHRLGWGHR
jgi:DNA-binding IclR family transcriptional regulator